MKHDKLVTDRLLQQFDVEREHLITSFEKIWTVFNNVVCNPNSGEIVCILDAVNQCKEKQLSHLAQKLGQIYADPGGFRRSHLKVILTSRPYVRIKLPFTSSMPLIHLSGEDEPEIEEISTDIGLVIKRRIRELVQAKHLDRDMENLLQDGLLGVPNRTYLWVNSTLKTIEESDFKSGGMTRGAITEMISRTPPTVDCGYERILTNSSDRVAAKQLLELVISAVRPLTLWEMETALNVVRRANPSSPVTIVRKRTPNELQQYIRELCGLFMAVIEEKVYLLHPSAKEFLVSPSNKRKRRRNGKDISLWKHSLETRASHNTMSKSCVYHLLSVEHNFATEASHRGEPWPRDVNRHAFLDYSAKHWAHHLRHSSRETQEESIQHAMKLCDVNRSLFKGWFDLHWTQTNTRSPGNLNPLIVAAILGLEPVVTRLIQSRQVGIQNTDHPYGISALSWAAGNGFDPVVKVLVSGVTVRSKANALFHREGYLINSVDSFGQTPLSYAILNGSRAVVRTLVDAGARLDIKDKIGGTPLLYAICKNQQGIIDLLTRKGAPSTDESNDDVRSKLLLSAARSRHETVVAMLLENTTTTKGIVTQEVLEVAAGRLPAQIINLLLGARQEGVSIDEETLTEAMKNPDSRVLIRFLAHQDACKLTEEVAKIVARGKSPEAMAHVLEHGGEEIITDDVILVAAATRPANGVLELLVSHMGTPAPSFQAAMKRTAAGRHADIMRGLLEVGGKTATIDETVLVAAAGNVEIGGLMMKVILNRTDGSLVITESVLKAAAGNIRQGAMVLRLLRERKGGQIVITQNIVVAAVKSLYGNPVIDSPHPLTTLRGIMAFQKHISIDKEALSVIAAVKGEGSGKCRLIAKDFVASLIAIEEAGKLTFTFEGEKCEAVRVLDLLGNPISDGFGSRLKKKAAMRNTAGKQRRRPELFSCCWW